MAVVTYNLKDATGATMTGLNPVVKFTLNRGNITASGGGLRPDKPAVSIPSSDGTGSINLEPTVSMLADAWYAVRIEWLDNVGNLITYMDFQIRVPAGGGSLSDLADLGGASGGANQLIWWVGLTEPPSHRYIWLQMNPNDNTDPAGTGDVRQWR